MVSESLQKAVAETSQTNILSLISRFLYLSFFVQYIYIYIYIYIYTYINYINISIYQYISIYIYTYIRSICGQQLFRSLRADQRSSDQMKILKDQSAQTTTRAVGIANRL